MSALMHQKNKKTLRLTLAIVAGMVVLSFASVPLYRRICQVTGWGGTTQEVRVNPFHGQQFAREITVRFDASTAPDMPWRFKPEQTQMKVRLGQDGYASYLAENISDKPVTGTAVYNVTPLKAGKYFYKTQCFCFGEQTLNPHQKVHMPLSFFVDPKISEDYDLKDLTTITLSYTFYKKDSQGLEKAVENFVKKTDNPVLEKKTN